MSLELVKNSELSSFDLVTEANHRIANHLAMIAAMLRTQGAQLGEKRQTLTGREVRLLLEEFGARLETVAEVHRLLTGSGDGAVVDVDAYLGSVSERIVSCLSGASEVTLECQWRAACSLSSEKAVTLGMLVGELVTNALKYAHPAGVPGKIGIDTSVTRDGFLMISVYDDGVGLPEGLDPAQHGGMGLRMIHALIANLGGTISFENHGLGLTCTLLIPNVRWGSRRYRGARG